MSSNANKDLAKVRAEELKTLLAKYDREYHIEDNPSIDDAVYDGLKSELKAIETKFPELLSSNSPNIRVVGEISKGFKSVKHKTRMLSLNDVFSVEDIDSWIVRISKLLGNKQTLSYFGDIKKDGLACSVIYQNGKYVSAITRGNGQVGEDVTVNVRTIPSVPLVLHNKQSAKLFTKGRVEVRGEIVMYKKDFEELNSSRAKEGLALYANPRNTAAGTIRQLDPALVAKRKLSFLAYDLLVDQSADLPSHVEIYRILKDLGFMGYEHSSQLDTVQDIHNYIDKWVNQRDTLAYNIDGLVIKVNSRSIYRDLGIVGKTPRGAIAYKFPAEKATTIVKDIFISIGRTGSATPVAILESVVVDGSTVQMATLHNESEIIRKDIRVADTVVIHKAGDIIPEVVEPIIKLRKKDSKPFIMPSLCPECGTKLIKVKKEDAAWRCPNTACPARTQKHIEHFASKAALDIEGLGEKNVQLLLQSGLIKDQADIFTLTSKQLLKLDRFADVSANKLVTAIAENKQPELARFIFALGIRHVGVQTAIDLASWFGTLDKLLIAQTDDLSSIDGVGEVVAESIVAWFSDKENQNLLNKFKQQKVWPKDHVRHQGKLSGMRFVITGSLGNMSRTIAADKIRNLGGIFQSALGKDTDYLVVGDKVGASKLKKAKEYGTKQLTEAEFLQLLTDK